MTPLGRWWALRTSGQRAVLMVVAAVVVINVLVAGAGELFGREPGGPTASSYATGETGLAALADLYEANGHDVERLRRSLVTAELDPAVTLVVAEPRSILAGDLRALERFVTAGGRLVVAGRGAAPVARSLIDAGIRWSPVGPPRWEVLAPVPEAGGATRVVGNGGGSWSSPGAGLPFLGASPAAGAVVGVIADLGRGRVIALAEVSPLQNRNLDRAGNASLALGLVGDGRAVVFDEATHGYRSGPGALPGRWWRALAVALAAVLVAMWSAARRLGPPQDDARPLPPPRRRFVDALAVSLARTRDPAAAVAPLQRRARDRLAVRLGLGPEAGRREVEAAAQRAGMAAEDVATLFEAPANDADVMAVGRAAARQEGGTW